MPRDRERGARYFNQRRVSLEEREEDGIAATVEGSEGAAYEVKLDWRQAADHGHMVVRCSCPSFADRMICKHVWATIIAFDRAQFKEPVPGKGPLELNRFTAEPEPEPSAGETSDPVPPGLGPRGEYLFELLSKPRRTATRQKLPRRPSPPRTAPRRQPAREATPDREPPWRRQLGSVRSALDEERLFARAGSWSPHREVLYRLNVARCFELDEMVVDLYQRPVERSGELGRPKKLNLIHEVPKHFSDPADRDLLQLFKANPTSDFDPYAARHRASYVQARGTVPALLYDTLLPRLCATGRFGWIRDHNSEVAAAPALRWQGEEPWRFALRLERSPAAGDRVRLHGLLRRGEESQPLAEPILLLANGAVLWPDRIGRLDAAEDFPWISQLRGEGEIEVPEAELDLLLDDLAGLPDLPELEMPPEWRWDEVRPAPRPRLALRPAQHPRSALLEGEVGFDYDGCLVAARQSRDRVFDRRRRRLVHRDREAEETAFEQLENLGARRSWGVGPSGCDVELSEGTFRTAVGPLIAAGWRVEAEGRRIRSAGGVSLSLASGIRHAVGGQTIDWFELRGEVDFGGQASVALPRLLESLRGGERMIRLDDGSHGMLPEAWLERFGPLARMAHGEEDGALRYLPSQAALLDALLAAEPEVDVDRDFARLRARLRSFERIEPAAEPTGFRGQLRAYQQGGLGWLGFLQDLGLGGCLADDMGLGKTVQVLALLAARRRPASGDRPALIVAPRSVVHNWLEEAARFTPLLKAIDYSGPRRKRLLPVLAKHHLVVTTYGLVRRDVAALREVDFDYVVLDEAQAIKNPASQGAKAARLLRAEHRLALTGTPVENHLGELWSIFEFLNPGMLGRLPAFQGLTRGRALENADLEGIARALKPFILRRTKDEVLDDLPEKTEQTLYCELGRRQWQLYRELRDHYRSALDRRIETDGLGRTKIHVLEALLRLRQAACHPGLVDPAHRDQPSAKLDTLLEQLDEVLEEGHKALVFSQFVSLLEIVKRRLKRREANYEYLDGQTRDRRRRIDRFQTDPDCRLFLISLKAGGLGLNLTAASYVFILDPWWNPAVEAQAVDRAHRIGQTRPVFAYRLIASRTVEEKILELQQSKRELADAILSASGSMIQNLTAEDLRLLLS